MTLNFRNFSLLVAVVAVLAAGGCRSRAIYNVENAAIRAPHSATIKDVEQSIIKAGARRGWVMKPVGPGALTGSYKRGGLSASIDIAFTRTNYSITYKDSQNLGYDGTSIHKRYVAWIRKLSKTIRREARRAGNPK